MNKEIIILIGFLAGVVYTLVNNFCVGYSVYKFANKGDSVRVVSYVFFAVSFLFFIAEMIIYFNT